MFRRIRAISIPTLLIAAAACALPAGASAMSVGMESNGELVNSTQTPALQDAALATMQAQGVQVVRVNYGWGEIAANCAGQSTATLGNPDNGCYNWASLDSLVSLARNHNIKVLLSTMRVPAWLFPAQCAQGAPADQNLNGGTGQSPASCSYVGKPGAEFNLTVANYAAFMKAVGTRYRAGSTHGTIPYFTIWNEPGSATFFYPSPNPTLYAQMYGAAAVALKTASPTALVAPGPTGPKSTYKPVPFIQVFQTAVVKYLPRKNPRRYINAWAHNPYPLKPVSPFLKGKGFGANPAIHMNNVTDIFKVLDKKSITKGLPVWATEFGFETITSTNAVGLKEAPQAQYIAEAFNKLASVRRVTIGISYGQKDPAEATDWQSGTIRTDGSFKPSFYMYQRMISVPTGAVKHGAKIAVWGRSNVSPKTGRLVYAAKPTGPWYFVAGAKRTADGSMTATYKTAKKGTVYFAVYDGLKTASTNNNGYGLYRAISVR